MAYKVFHRSLTAGVALAGAGAIAFSTLPVLPSDHVPAVAAVQSVASPRLVITDVEYASLASALQLLVEGATATVRESLATFNGDIPALWAQVGIGVPGALWEDPYKLPWSHSLLAESLFAPLAPFAVGPFTDAVVEVLAQTFTGQADQIREELPQAIDYAFARLIGPVISALGATGKVHQEIYLAGIAGNSPGQWLAILRSPITVLDGFFNGGYGDISALITGEVGGERIAAPGLFTPWGQYPVDRTVTVPADDEVSSARVADDETLVSVSLEKTAADESDVIETVATVETADTESLVSEASSEESAEDTGAVEQSESTDDTESTDKVEKAETVSEKEDSEKPKMATDAPAKDASDNSSEGGDAE